LAATFSLGAIPGTSIVVGGRVGYMATVSPVVETNGQRFTLPHYQIESTDVSALVRYYPDPYGGFHLGGGIGVVRLVAEELLDAGHSKRLPQSDQPLGVSLSPEIGYGHWLGVKVRLGLVTRVTVARIFGKPGDSTLVAPVLLGAFSWN